MTTKDRPGGYDEHRWRYGKRRKICHDPLTPDDIDQIIKGIEHFCIGLDNRGQELDAIWRPYIDKLRALKNSMTSWQA